MTFAAFVAVLWAVAVSIFWMVVGWRAMRAHEALAAEARALRLNHGPPSDGPQH